MKKTTRQILNVKPVTNYLSEPGTLADNELQQAFSQILFKRILYQGRFKKSKGDELIQVMFALLIWPLLRVQSISNFCGKQLNCFIRGGSNVLYDFQKREDLNWRKLRQLTAKKIFFEHGFEREEIKAYVFDDTLKHRRGSKVEATSWHFDHTEGRSVRGQQMLEMGLVSSKGYLPIDSQIYVGDSKKVLREQPFADKRSAVSIDYKNAVALNKNEMLREMIKRANRLGLKADYVIADSWFGNKGNIQAVIEQGQIGIFRMKRNITSFRINGRLLSAKALYWIKKKHARKTKGLPWKSFCAEVEMNIGTATDKDEHWVKVLLVFTVPKDEHSGEFGLFLCTDTGLSKEKVLEVYSLRWSIEVYFKEVKQNMGLLWEQTGNYVCHYASIHLAAIRYLLFTHLLIREGGTSFSGVRNRTTMRIELLTYANLLWEFFKALIHGALAVLIGLMGEKGIAIIKTTIDTTVTEFLEAALQIDCTSFKVEARASPSLVQ